MSSLPAKPIAEQALARQIPAEWLHCLGAIVLSVFLTLFFWADLWEGGGLVGGDSYVYFLPQKTFLSNHLATGEIPLWNNLAGHGYPLLAESQTGLCYPLTIPLYHFFPVNTAYNINLLLHYAIAFFASWLLGRSIGLKPLPACLAALVYTYGWFPPRVHWEWSYQSGAWLPLAFWCAESFAQTGRQRFVLLLCATVAWQLSAGIFTLRFTRWLA